MTLALDASVELEGAGVEFTDGGRPEVKKRTQSG
jgi:hypothetical protein